MDRRVKPISMLERLLGQDYQVTEPDGSERVVTAREFAEPGRVQPVAMDGVAEWRGREYYNANGVRVGYYSNLNGSYKGVVGNRVKTFSSIEAAKQWVENYSHTIGAADRAPAEAERTYKVSGNADVLERLDKFLAYVAWCSGVGHTCTVGFDIDGDGADRLRLESGAEVEVDEDDVRVIPGDYEVLG